jgi:hypothetical protein
MKRLRIQSDESGLIQVLEFLATFTIFLLILSAFFSSLATQFPRYETTDVTIREKAEEIAEILISSPGFVESGDTSWEGPGYDPYTLNYGNNKLARLGLARDYTSYGILSLAKISGLKTKVYYITMEDVFALTSGQIMNITIYSLDSHITYLVKGGSRTGATTNYASYTRIVLVDEGDSKLTPCKLIVHLFCGGKRP